METQLLCRQEGHMGHLRQGFVGWAVQLQETAILQPVIFLPPEQTPVQALPTDLLKSGKFPMLMQANQVAKSIVRALNRKKRVIVFKL